MPLRMIGVRSARRTLWAALLCGSLAPALAGSTRLALVIGNSDYTALPPLPACAAAAQGLARALSGLGYQVIERRNVTSGGLSAAIGEFDRAMVVAPAASVFVYVCGYAADMNDHPFLLPVSANLRRPSDVMTQGLLAKATVDTLVRGAPSRGVLALDLVPAAGVAAPVLDDLGTLPLPAGVGLIAATTAAPTAQPMALGVALAAGLGAPGVQSGALLADLKARLQDHPATQVAVLRPPEPSRPLAADEPAPAVPAQEAPRVAGSGPAAGADAPAEAAMSEAERRQVQEALGRLGYYGAPVDGRFGPETRAAIRRFQHELGAAMTGRITRDQVARLGLRN